MKIWLVFIILLGSFQQGLCQNVDEDFSYESYLKMEKKLNKARKQGAKKSSNTKLFEDFRFGMSNADVDEHINKYSLLALFSSIKIDNGYILFSKNYFFNDNKLSGLKLLVSQREIEKQKKEVEELSEIIYKKFSSHYNKGKWFKLYNGSYAYVEKNLNITIDPFDLGHRKSIVILFFDSQVDERHSQSKF